MGRRVPWSRVDRIFRTGVSRAKETKNMASYLHYLHSTVFSPLLHHLVSVVKMHTYPPWIVIHVHLYTQRLHVHTSLHTSQAASTDPVSDTLAALTMGQTTCFLLIQSSASWCLETRHGFKICTGPATFASRSEVFWHGRAYDAAPTSACSALIANAAGLA